MMMTILLPIAEGQPLSFVVGGGGRPSNISQEPILHVFHIPRFLEIA